MIFKKCPSCDFENSESAKFCNECGAKLGAEENFSSLPHEPAEDSSQPRPSEPTPPEPAKAPLEPPLDIARAWNELTLLPANFESPSAPPNEVAAEPPLPSAGAPLEMPASLETVEALMMAPTEPQVADETPSEFEASESETAPVESPVEDPALLGPFGARFRVIEELGKGTLGTVFKVFDKAMERELALKAVKPEISQKAELFEGFNRELKAERSIVHKNIVRIFELSTVKGTPFITMEYTAGKDLRSVLKEKRRLPVREAFSIAKQLFSGLAQMHEAGVLHLDLRPENVMIEDEGTVKIMDLGIARLFRDKGIIRSVAGMPQYMSPEQIEGCKADGRSDIFAVGVMIYEMLTGNLPPVGEIARSPRDINPSIPRELSLLVLKCIEPDKEKRFQTAQEIRAELESIEAGVSQTQAEEPVQIAAEKPAEPKPAVQPPPMTAAEPARKPGPVRIQTRARTRRFLPLPDKAVFPAAGALALIILAFVLWRFVFGPSKGAPSLPAQPPRLSLAVLPFEDISPTNGRQHLGAAMAEILIRRLEKTDNLFVPAAESSSLFKGKTREGRQVGRRLHVEHYLEGTFEAQNDKIKIDARLVRSDSGAPVWSGQYERTTAEIFALQEEIARAVSKSLGVEATPANGSPLRHGDPANFIAYDFYAQARFLVSNKGKENLEKAIDLFSKAGAEDPTFALAFTGLSDAYFNLADGHYWAPDKAIPKAKEAAQKALLLDSGLADAHTALARIKTSYEWDFTWAEKEYREALRLDPNNASAHQSYALQLSALGRHGEAARESQLAQTYNPLSSEVNAQAVTILYFARQYEEAEAEANKALATDPLYPGHYIGAALIQVQLGQLDQARQSLKEAEDLGSDPIEIELLRACILARQGERQEVGRILTEAFNSARKAYVSQVSMALVYASLNERDQAVACLENAFAGRDASLICMRVHPLLDSVRGDARFAVLLRRIGL